MVVHELRTIRQQWAANASEAATECRITKKSADLLKVFTSR
jgi:hypothetical protein